MKKIVTFLGILGTFIFVPNFAMAGYFNNAPINSCSSVVSSDIGYGNEGNAVLNLQSVLKTFGYLSVTPNGYFGPSTRNAVMNFQRDNYLPMTGFVGYATSEALNSQL